MSLHSIGGACLVLVFTSTMAMAQQTTETTESAATSNDRAPARRVVTRNQSAGRETVVETTEAPNVDGKMAPARETVVETTRTPTGAQTKREVYVIGPDGRRTLAETTDSQQQATATGTATVHETRVRDLNGRLDVTTRETQETRSATPGVRETSTTVETQNPDGALQGAARTESSERRNESGAVNESATMVRDINGRWQPVETRRSDVRETSAAASTEEETVQHRDMNGALVVDERNVTSRSKTNGTEYEVVETYTPDAGVSSSNGRPTLSQRVNRTTTTAADGSRSIVEEVEARNPAAPSDPMRVTRRTATTERRVGDRVVTERQVFERDANGRFQLVTSDSQETAGK